MAAKTPVTDRTTSGFVDPHRGVWTGAVSGGSMLANGKLVHGREGMRLQIFFFDDVDDGDTWDSAIPQIRAVAWQPEDSPDDNASVILVDESTGQVGFTTENANSSGWLWVLSGGSG